MRIESQDDITIRDVSANATNWTLNHERHFRVTYQDTDRGLDITSANPKPGVCLFLGIEPVSLLLNEISKIRNVTSVRMHSEDRNVLVVETVHRDGRDWAEVTPKVNALIMAHLCPPKKPSLISRFLGRAA